MQGVQATIVNVGPSDGSRLPAFAAKHQARAIFRIQLSDGSRPDDLADHRDLAQYQVNGSPATPISSDSGTRDGGARGDGESAPAGTSTITVSQSASAISNALSSFRHCVQCRGGRAESRAAGKMLAPLSGQSIIFSLTSRCTNWRITPARAGSFTSLTDLGLSFDTNGHLNFDPTALSSVQWLSADRPDVISRRLDWRRVSSVRHQSDERHRRSHQRHPENCIKSTSNADHA